MKLIPLKGGIEQDCLTPWGRKYIKNDCKLIKYAKRKFNKRVRKQTLFDFIESRGGNWSEVLERTIENER